MSPTELSKTKFGLPSPTFMVLSWLRSTGMVVSSLGICRRLGWAFTVVNAAWSTAKDWGLATLSGWMIFGVAGMVSPAFNSTV